MLSSSLKVGHSFGHAVQAVADQGRPPASEEFGRMLAETQLGKPLDAALSDLGARIRSDNLAFVLTAVAIQREVGGSLANLFEVVAETVRERQQLARKLRSLTAMGRASAGVLVALPFAAALGLSALNPDYMQPLYASSTGHVLIGLGFVMIVIGSLLLKRIVTPGR
jgi:tight adherence protein B